MARVTALPSTPHERGVWPSFGERASGASAIVELNQDQGHDHASGQELWPSAYGFTLLLLFKEPVGRFRCP